MKFEENTVLFDQIVDHIGLVAIQPTGGRRDDDLQRRKDSIHAGDGMRIGASIRR